jgi:hypothetical protein
MKPTFPILLLLAPALAGCNPESPTSPPGEITAAPGLSQALRRSPVPISGRCEGSYEIIPIDFLPPPFEDLAAHGQVLVRETCRIAHLGKTTTLGDNLTDFTGDPFVSAGSIVLTAANGDELWATETGAVPGPGPSEVFTWSGSLTFTGGTGRFQGATGTATFVGGGSTTNSTNFRSFHGTIAY